jgi:hypothetical protein
MKRAAISDLGCCVTKDFLNYSRHRVLLEYGNQGDGVKTDSLFRHSITTALVWDMTPCTLVNVYTASHPRKHIRKFPHF